MSSSRLRRWALAAVPLALLALLASACSSDDSTSDPQPTNAPAAPTTPAADTAPTAVPAPAPVASDPATTPTPSDAAFPVKIAAANGAVTITARPTAIISLSPTATEILFAVGAGEQVLAVDDQSNFPAEAKAKASELSGFEPNVEAIAGMKPDLVVIGDDSKSLAASLATLGIVSIVQPSAATLEDVYAQIEQLGAATGHLAESVALSSSMQTDIESIVASAPKSATPITFFHEVDNTGYSATSATFIGELYHMLGLENIADLVEDNTGYPQLSIETIVKANPDVIFLGDALYGESAETVKARPAWGTIEAVKNGNIVALDSDVASRWGPRTVDLLRQIVDAMAKVAVPA